MRHDAHMGKASAMGARYMLGSFMNGLTDGSENAVSAVGFAEWAGQQQAQTASNNSLSNLSNNAESVTGWGSLQNVYVSPNTITYPTLTTTGIWVPPQPETTAEDVRQLMERRYWEQIRQMEQTAKQAQIQEAMSKVASMKPEEPTVDPAEVRANGGKRAIEL
jgi:hypothetical protein